MPIKLAMCAVRLSVNICTPFRCGALRKHSQRLQIEWSEFFQCALIDQLIRGTYPMYLFTLKLFVIQSHSLFGVHKPRSLGTFKRLIGQNMFICKDGNPL